ncbi:WD40 repeat, conserved site [Phytophthora cactorum]|nr:WD40 repeat, conserved site [Phytophthora cactorum]
MDATLATFDTVETADCVESCPAAGFESSMVVATYQLHKAVEIGEPEDRRSGTLQHFQLSCDDAASTDGANVSVQKLEETMTSSGIFDIKWNTEAMNGKAVLGAATAGGSLELYELVREGNAQTLRHSGLATDADANSMCLSLDWNNRMHSNAQPSICVSHSDGALSVWDIASQGIVQKAKWRAHDLFGSPIEAWIAAFNCHDPNVLFSGADDAALKGWDLRAGTTAPTFKNVRQYSMGVCSIQFHPHDERLVAVGSYDEQVAIWDHRSMTRPLAVYGAGGGVWRLKWHPAESRKELLLAACMHNGFQLLELAEDQTELRKAASYDRHDSLAYGMDWWLHPAVLQAKAPVVGSASFYDHIFHAWRLPISRARAVIAGICTSKTTIRTRPTGGKANRWVGHSPIRFEPVAPPVALRLKAIHSPRHLMQYDRDLDFISSSPSSLYAEDEVLTVKQELASVSGASPTGSSSSNSTLALPSIRDEIQTTLLSPPTWTTSSLAFIWALPAPLPTPPPARTWIYTTRRPRRKLHGLPALSSEQRTPSIGCRRVNGRETERRQTRLRQDGDAVNWKQNVAHGSCGHVHVGHARQAQNPVVHTRTGGNTVNIGRRNAPPATAAGLKHEQEDGNATTPTKKTKVSRERQLKINAASRRCRKKQKLELQFLRTHVVELQVALKDQVNYLQGQLSNNNAQLDSLTSSDLLPFRTEDHSGEDTDGTHSNDPVNHIETDDASSVHTIDPATGYSLSDQRKKELLNIASFVRVNISLESSSFAPEVISCLPIEMDGWQLRLAITEKNYTIHNQKFFPCNVKDMFDFCWETNVAQKISIKHAKKHYVVVTPLDQDVAHVYSKTTGKWSLNVHGVPNVSYNSIVCRRFMPEEQRAIICQQSVLEERDFQDESTLPWLFKRWVVFRPQVQDGVEGTFVEAYRTASYATGRLIYKENKTYEASVNI